MARFEPCSREAVGYSRTRSTYLASAPLVSDSLSGVPALGDSAPRGTLPPERLPEDRLVAWLTANAREMEPRELTEYALENENEGSRRRLTRDMEVKPAASEAPVMPVDWGTW